MKQHVDTAKQPPAILSLCTGGGMLDDGLERALGPVRTVAYVEIEAFCVWNLVAKMEAGLWAHAPVFTNLKTFPAKPFHRKIHGIIGGYPCQPFSHAGQRKGEADERHLFPHICTIIDAVRPLWCFFENVPGHLSMGYDEVYRSLRALGYTVEAGIFSAAEVGATHNRERLFILAVENTAIERQISAQQQQTEQGRINGISAQGNGDAGNTPQRQNDRRSRGNMDAAQCEGRCINATTHSASEAMGDTAEPRCEDSRPAGIGQLQTQGRERIHDRPEFTSDEFQMGDTAQQRIQGQRSGGQQITRAHDGAGLPVRPNGSFPAPPGHPQHHWEAPHVESGLGFSAHGYNFREDLLRMAGNGVVPQTAAKAFIELSAKIHQNLTS